MELKSEVGLLSNLRTLAKANSELQVFNKLTSEQRLELRAQIDEAIEEYLM